MDIDIEKVDPNLHELRPEVLSPPAIVKALDLSDLSFSAAFRNSGQSPEENLAEHLRQHNSRSPTHPQQTPILPNPLREDLEPEKYDGAFIGADGKLYSSDNDFRDIPLFTPQGVTLGKEEFPTIYINGILTPVDRANSQMKQLARSMNAPVLGIYNATESELEDVLQSILDRFDLGNNPSARNLQRLIQEALRTDKPLHIFAESQGAIITSRALSNAIQSMKAEGMSDSELERRLGNLRVETIAGGAWVFPDGPQYVHYVNDYDPIPSYFGVGKYGVSPEKIDEYRKEILVPEWFSTATSILEMFELDRIQGIHPGKDARIIHFQMKAKEHWLETHIMKEYLKYRIPFEEAYASEADLPFADEHKARYARPLLAAALLALGAFTFRRWRRRRKALLAKKNSEQSGDTEEQQQSYKNKEG